MGRGYPFPTKMHFSPSQYPHMHFEFEGSLISPQPITVPFASWMRALIPLDKWFLHPGRIEVTVGAPIPTDDWQLDEADARVEQMRTAVAECIERSRVRYEEPTTVAVRGGVHLAPDA